jgi:hypothetical protein
MRKKPDLEFQFVEFIPNSVSEKVIYISTTYATVVHKCCCGCGAEIVTPLSPTDWKLIFDGETVSLYPSIGNWSLDCKSHYFIRENKVAWAPPMSRKEIEAARNYGAFEKENYFSRQDSPSDPKTGAASGQDLKSNIWQRLWRFIGR